MIYRYYKDADGKLQDGIVLPRQIDNRDKFPPIADQGQRPWCAAYSISQICEYLIWKEYGKLVALDEGELYKQAKLIDGMPDQDGTSLQAAIQAALDLGSFAGKVVIEPIAGNREAIRRAIHKYDVIHVGLCITSAWYAGTPTLPSDGGYYPLGGHAVALVGFDDDGPYIANSWGCKWGDRGFAQWSWDEVERTWLCGFGVKVI